MHITMRIKQRRIFEGEIKLWTIAIHILKNLRGVRQPFLHLPCRALS